MARGERGARRERRERGGALLIVGMLLAGAVAVRPVDAQAAASSGTTAAVVRLDLPDEQFSRSAVVVSDAGAVYGARNDQPGPQFGAFVWHDGQVHQLTGSAGDPSPGNDYADGSMVRAGNRAGRVVGTTANGWFVWDPVEGLLTPPAAPAGVTYFPVAVDAKGRAVVNRLVDGVRSGVWRWDPDAKVFEALGPPTWSAVRVSPDGEVIAGWPPSGSPVRWTASEGLRQLDTPTGSLSILRAEDDGRVLGSALRFDALSQQTLGVDAVVWFAGSTAFDATELPQGVDVAGVDDHETFVGVRTVAGVRGEAVRWSKSLGLQVIAQSGVNVAISQVNAQGDIVGFLGRNETENGFAWTAQTGLVLLNDGTAQLEPTALSEDGRTIAGQWVDGPQGRFRRQPFFAHLVPGDVAPDPSTTAPTTPSTTPPPTDPTLSDANGPLLSRAAAAVPLRVRPAFAG